MAFGPVRPRECPSPVGGDHRWAEGRDGRGRLQSVPARGSISGVRSGATADVEGRDDRGRLQSVPARGSVSGVRSGATAGVSEAAVLRPRASGSA